MHKIKSPIYNKEKTFSGLQLTSTEDFSVSQELAPVDLTMQHFLDL